MADESKAVIPAKYDLNAKWDVFLDLGTRRFIYSSFAGAFTGLLLFLEPPSSLSPPIQSLTNLSSMSRLGLTNKKTVCIQAEEKDQSVVVATTKTTKQNKAAS